MEFLKSSELELNAAGYLVSKVTKKPVTQEQFVQQQKAAEYVVKLGEAIKDKNFKCAAKDNFDAIRAEVLKGISAASIHEYVAVPVKPTSKVNDEMIQFALDFNNFEDQKAVAEKINLIMAEFNTINDVESVGEYFSEGLVKLAKIYTTAEILAAVQLRNEKLS